MGAASRRFFPRAKVIAMRARLDDSVPVDQGEDADETDVFLASVPKDLTLRDCLVETFKDKTIDEQRSFFIERMQKMAREGRDKEDGWKYKQKTNAMGVEFEDQIDVYEREVEWSSVKQLRSVVETEFTCDQVFDYLRDHHGRKSFPSCSGSE